MTPVYIADSPAACQHLLDMVDQRLQWSGMRAKVFKCHSLEIQGSTGKLGNPELELAGGPILFIGSRSIEFLGMRIQVPYDVTVTKEALTAILDWILQADDTLLSNKAPEAPDCSYNVAVCPGISWLLLIANLDRMLQAVDTCPLTRHQKL